ncbi:phosphoribosylglycinamide formyltransferase [Lactococcus garvieae subsp. garvieae]|uniref:phosphoribosylglycinamide formyltransferase n=1 Tax=Lactococcus garvieae TaxID=1363 RepID=UPI0005A77F71|nr:phosphoribosylglycinamide formyltransferase [Lactococcus garvieae]KAA8712803.1 phosphoribosylglycinamide formyltransferase [Lactococcus garvieae subsp. garvieae]MDG6191005.1 phosphoribosylglycinamide formyltransferase [Lactococcus garvieae]QPR48187.1 phosphoribosylglycinamide formyltransferase [Lactococcus garvieae]
MRIAVFASGSGSNFEALAQAFPTEIQLLFSDKTEAYALQRAQKLNVTAVSFTLKSFADKQSYEETLVALLRDHQIDLICLAGYMKIVGPTLLQAYEGRIINIHPSYLPAFAGSAHALEESWQAQEGLGITVHWVDSGVDTGEILAQQQLDYHRELAEYEKKLHQAEHELYIKVVQELIKK